MYCPRCATQLTEATTYCPGCDFDVRPVARLLYQEMDVRPSTEQPAGGMAKVWQQQRHALGLLLILCSLLVGCFIPISIGLLNGFIGLGSLITSLAGIAGVLLIVGTWLRSRGGLWIALGLGAIPLFFALNTIVEGFWRGTPAAP